MIDYIAYILVITLNKIFGLIPINVSLGIGRRLGSFGFFFNKKRRLIAYANLKAAFAREKSPHELKRLTKRVYQNLVETFVEILNLTKVSVKYVDKYVEVVNYERIVNASQSGRGTILLTAHFGDWELSSLVSAIKGFPLLVLAREQKMKRLNELLNRLRESKGCKVIRKGISTKNILRALYDKEMVGILSDQDAGRNGVFVNLFGRPTSTHSGAVELAKRTDSLVIPNFIVRTKGPYHKLYLEEYIDFRTINGDEDMKDSLQKYANVLESYIRRYPDQWLWLHKRWKSTPLRTILVLNDGRQGHLNQSLAVADEIQKARTTQGHRIDDTKIIVVDVKYKNRFARTALSICANFASWRCHGCMGCMKACLDKGTYETLMASYAEFVVSCGSSLAPVNIFMSKENNAKNVIIMRSKLIMGLKKFSLAIIPQHDNPPVAGNVLVTKIAPNLIGEETLKADGERLKKIAHIEKSLVLGLLIGGDNPEYSLTKEIINQVIDNVVKFCEEHDAELLVTTSRRTSAEVDNILKNKLKNNPRCKLLIIANEANVKEAVSGILSLSNVTIVSGESISMVSEGITSGKRTIAFELEKRKDAVTKHEAALKDLEREGYLTVAKAGNLYLAIEKAWQDKAPIKKIEDSDKIFTAVRRLI